MQRFLKTRFLIGAAALAALSFSNGCSSPPRDPAQAKGACNPLGGGAGEDCLLPFPSSVYLREDPSTVTRLRVDLPTDALPKSMLGARLDPAPYNHRDGFSSVATLLAYFPAAIDPVGLPTPERTAASRTPESPVQLIRYDDGERVPLFAELDSNAKTWMGDRQALILQPIVRLRPGTRYVAVIQGLKDRDGHAVAPLSGFRALRDGKVAAGSPQEALRSRFEEIFVRLARSGVTRAGIQLAWDFTTGSDEAIVGRMVRMRDQVLSSRALAAARSGHAIEVQKVEENPDKMPELRRRIEATFKVPSYLVDGGGDRLQLNPEGEPVVGPEHAFPLTIHVPACAASAREPLPVVIYGHGTFNTARAEMANPYGREIINRICAIEVGTDWLGRTKSDLSYYLTRILPNWNNFPQITDRLQQAHLNVVALARLVRSGALESIPALKGAAGASLFDASRIYYYGISEGGCQGVTSLALSPDIERGAMNVPCGFWSMFFWRSSDFHYTRRVLGLSYPDALQQQKIMTLSQLLWDYTDPANYGAHVLRDPLPGNTPKRLLYQEGINDASVPNLTTRAMARTLGLKHIGPVIEAVEGVDESHEALESGYVQFGASAGPKLGLDNVPPAVSGVHEEIRRLDAAKEQLTRFLRRDGRVQNTCGGGPCRFPAGPAAL